MIQILVLSAILVIGSAVDETKLPIAAAQPDSQDLKDEPSNVKRMWGDGVDEDHRLSDAENRIVQDVFSPDYYEPNIILDYRYLKSGGRGYTRSDGGQIMILPKSNKKPVTSNNYDTLIEFLRLKHLGEVEKKLGSYLQHERDASFGSRKGPDAYYDYLDEIEEGKGPLSKSWTKT